MAQSKSMAAPAQPVVKPLLYVVDDEVTLLELAAVVLEPHGYRVATFRDPEQALKTFTTTQHRPALIITDYAMHAMNGMELIEKCKELDPRQKIVLASGTVEQDIYAHSPVKPDGFLPKPYKAQELVALVRDLIGQ